MGEEDSEEHLIEALLHKEEKIAKKFNRHIKKTHPNIHNRLKKTLNHEVSRQISHIFTKCQHDINTLSDIDFAELIRLYNILDTHSEIAKLHHLRSESKSEQITKS